MAYSKPVQVLVDEHDVILSVLDAVEAVVSQNSTNGDFPADFYAQAADFFAMFADKCHHAKEETLLFPRLEARGLPRYGGPIAVMLSDHNAGRQYMATVHAALPAARAGDRAAQESARGAFVVFASQLRSHIFKENNVLFMLADQVMTTADIAELSEEFKKTESTVVPPGTHCKYLALANELRRTAGLEAGHTVGAHE